jgi:Asp-tRNA(Asn)/Glu-tRNA(Gln) amidotransferase A subunit family amidase
MPLTRRRFLETCAASGAAAALGPADAARAADSPVSSPVPNTAAVNGITADTLAAAEKLGAIEFTAKQREPLVKTVVERAAGFSALRTSALPNHVFPAVAFDARLAGIAPPPATSAVAPLAGWQPPTVARPASAEDLAFLSVAELAALLRAGLVTSRELTELSLARLRKFDPLLKAVVTLTAERALRQADAADAELRAGRWRGPLHGVPWGAKDLLAVRGYPTTWGAAQFQDRVIDEEAEVVRRLDAAGAVLVAKLSLGALASGDTWFRGQTKCPWNPAVGSSGSSAGPGAAVAAGLVPFAIGSETLGSIVSPCTRNAVCGLRPSYGRVSRAGAMALAWSMDKLGPIARTAEDCALVFAAIHGADPADPTALDAPFAWPPAAATFTPSDATLAGQRIGFVAAQFQAQNDWHAINQAALKTLRTLGAELVPFELPPAPVNTLRLVLSVEAAAAFDALTLSGAVDDLVAPEPSNWAEALRAARFVPAVEYVQANRHRTALTRELEQRLADNGIDVWASQPAGPHLALTNLTGHPAVAAPSGFLPAKGEPADSPRRMAAGVTFNARYYHEERALAVAHAFQQATDFHRRRPPLA